MTAEDRGWGPGWPRCQPAKLVPLELDQVAFRAHEISGGKHKEVDFPGGIREEIHDLVVLLLLETQTHGYKLVDGWCWGFGCREVRGVEPKIPSNHSWGLAIDINAPTNPLKPDGPLVTDMPAWMPKLWTSYGFIWGGSYPTARKDAMHYEFVGRPADAERFTRKAQRELGGKQEVTKEQLEKLKTVLAWQRGFDEALGGKDAPPPDAAAARKRGYRAATSVLGSSSAGR
jgi:hypothetical protein